MNKPITVAYENFKSDLTKLINNSGLPAFVVELVLRDYLSEVGIIAQNQLQSDKTKYEKYLMSNSEILNTEIDKDGD